MVLCSDCLVKKTVSTRLAAFERKRFLELAKAKKKSCAELLRDAVVFFLDNHERIAKEKLADPDYDDGSEPRKSRLYWGS